MPGTSHRLEGPTVMIVWRALVLGLAFGLAAVTVEIGLNLARFILLRFGPGPLFFVRVVLMQIALGMLLGLALAPLLKLPRGALLHLLALALCWYGLQRWVGLDAPTFAMLQVAAPVGGAVLVLLGILLTRWRAIAAWAVAGVLIFGAIVTPQIYLRVTTPPKLERAGLPPARADAPDIVLVVLDTVRAMNVSAYGYERNTSPNFDALAREGALFLDATSPSTWSLPSHASLFTGRYPSSHRAHAEHRYLDDRFPTLAQVLERNGYETFCFTANAWISDGLGLTRGFAFQDESLKNEGGPGIGFSFIHRLLDRLGLQEGDKGGDKVISSFEAWARARPVEASRPAFVFLNLIEAHFPYHQLPHESLFLFTDRTYAELRAISIGLLAAQFGGEQQPVDEVQGPTRDMYDGGVAYSDLLLARIAQAMRQRGTLDRTIFVVLADHGEILGEHGGFFGHGPSLYQESVGVPLMVRYPPRVPQAARVETPVSTLGVFATIMDLAELEPPPTLQVASLVPLIADDGARAGGPILAELHAADSMPGGSIELDDPQMKGDRRYRLLRDGDLKLVSTSMGQDLLYDLATDPHETRDIGAERPEALQEMRARMESVRVSLDLPALDAALAAGEDPPELDEATRERLRALGYLE